MLTVATLEEENHGHGNKILKGLRRFHCCRWYFDIQEGEISILGLTVGKPQLSICLSVYPDLLAAID